MKRVYRMGAAAVALRIRSIRFDSLLCVCVQSEVWICMELMSTCLEKLLRYTREPVPERILGKIATCVRLPVPPPHRPLPFISCDAIRCDAIRYDCDSMRCTYIPHSKLNATASSCFALRHLRLFSSPPPIPFPLPTALLSSFSFPLSLSRLRPFARP